MNRLFKVIPLLLLCGWIPTQASACHPASPGTWRRLSDQMSYPGLADPGAVQVCEEMALFAKENCKESIKGKLFSQAALQYCRQLDSDKRKHECLDRFQGRYVSAEAMGVCLAMRSDFEKENCLSEIKDKVFESKDINECSRQGDHRKANCLSEKGFCIVEK